MMRPLFLLLLLALVVNAPSVDAGIRDFFTDDGVDLVVADPYVEMHTGPGRGFPVFHVIEKGERLHVFKQRTDWYKVRNEDGIEGWVARVSLQQTLSLSGDEVEFSAPTYQDYIDRRFEFGFLGGQFERADSLTTYLAFHLTPNISSELKYTQTFSSVGNNKLWSVNALHKPFPEWRVSPFFTLGAGEIDISPASVLVQSEDRKNPIYTVGGGALVYITRRFLMRMEYNKHTLLTKRENNEEVEEWKAGFSIFF